MARFVRSGRVLGHDVIVHQSVSAEQGKAAGTTQHATDHVFRRLLEPVADGILEYLVPSDRTYPQTRKLSKRWTNKTGTKVAVYPPQLGECVRMRLLDYGFSSSNRREGEQRVGQSRCLRPEQEDTYSELRLPCVRSKLVAT